MSLVTIADLSRPESELEPLIAQANKLGEYYIEFIKQDPGPYQYTVGEGAERERTPGIHASEMSGCLRKVVYSIQGTERRTDPGVIDSNMKMRFRVGTALHAMLQSDFQRMTQWLNATTFLDQGIRLAFEPELTVGPQAIARDWNLSSHCDGVFTFMRVPEQGFWQPYLRVGLEIKTSSDAEFKDRKKPEHKHLEQTCLYQRCLDLPLMWLLYYNKSNANFTTPYAPWLYRFDRNRWDNDLELRFAKAHHYAEIGQLPAREEGQQCRWCPFTWKCEPPKLSRNSNKPISPGLLLRRE